MKRLISILVLIWSAALPVCAETRGLALLPLKHPKFPVHTACEILKASPSPSFSVIHDVTFGSSDKNIHALIRCLALYTSTLVRPLRVHVYILTGPARRPRRNGSIPVFMPSLDISQFNKALQERSGFVARSFRKRVVLLRNLIARYPEIDWSVVVELEDNLNWQGYTFLKGIAQQALSGLSVEFTRNPLAQQRKGHEPTELHTYSTSRVAGLRWGDTVSGDGVADWPTMGLVKMCEQRGLHLQFWQPSMQGISRNPNVPPSKRTYRFIDVPRIKKLMRG